MYNEPVEELQPRDRDIHRALTSLKEEIEAVDWYHQRAAATQDPEIRAVVEHNRNEEMEHAAMLLERLRRTMPEWDAALRTYLFSTGSLTALEAAAADGGEGASAAGGGAPAGSLGIGSLKGKRP